MNNALQEKTVRQYNEPMISKIFYKAFYIIMALICFAIFGVSVYAIQIAQEQAIHPIFLYLAIAGIIGGLGGGIALLTQTTRAGGNRW